MTKDDALRLAQRALSNKNAPARVVYEALAAIRKVLQEERRCGPGVEMMCRKWQGLTDEQIEDLYFDSFSMGELKAFARAIEAKLKEKNT